MFRRKIFYLLYSVIGFYLPNSDRSKTARRMRRAFAKGFIKSCGENVNFQKKAVIPFDLCIGDNSGVGMHSIIGSGTVIGRDVMMGPECYVFTRNHAFNNIDIPMIQQGFQEVKPVKIEDDVWIGARVIILPGVIIGKGSIIGAGAVVTKSIPAYSIAAGNPARVVKKRDVTSAN